MIIPSIIGSDIGCGMCVIPFHMAPQDINFEEIEQFIDAYNTISGDSYDASLVPFIDEMLLKDVRSISPRIALDSPSFDS